MTWKVDTVFFFSVCVRHLGASAGLRGRMFASGLSCERTLQALGVALDKEQQQWKSIVPRPASSTQVCIYYIYMSL